eukprot:9620176-Heterocapsa_arctica.AAC.1
MKELSGVGKKDSPLRESEVMEMEIMEHDIDGSVLIHFIEETKDRKEWGGAEQIAVVAHMYK